MSTLLRFAWRELLRSKGRTALITLILAIQATALGGGRFSYESLFGTCDHYYEKLHLADLDVRFVAATPAEMPTLDALRKIHGVHEVSRRFIALGYIEKKDGSPLPVIIHHLDPEAHPTVDDIEMRKGSFLTPGDAASCVIDRSFAEAQGLAIGDKIVVNPHRFAMTYTVAGTALSPEYMVPTSNPDVLVPAKGSIGVIYGNRAQLDKLFLDKLYNELLFSYEPGADPEATTAAVLSALGALDIERATPKTSNFGYRYVKEILGARRIFMPATAIILAIMAAIVTFISVNRLVMSRRREIGGLLAMGFAPRQFIAGFLVLGMGPGLVGGLLGVPGAMAFGAALTRKNAEIAGLPHPIMTYTVENMAITVASAVLVGLLAVILPSFSILKLRPAHALRGGDEIRFTGLPGSLERMIRAGGVATRYAMRNVFRRVRLSLATAVLVALAIGLPAGFKTIVASLVTWAKVATSSLHYDATASFKVPLTDDQVRKVMNTRGVGDYEGYAQGFGTLLRDDAPPQDVRVRSVAVPSALVSLDLRGGTTFSANDADEAILNTAFSHSTPAPRVGETVTFVYRGKETKLKVVGLVSELSIGTVFAPLGTVQRIFGDEGKVSGVYLTFGAPTKPRPVDELLPPEPPRPEYAETIAADDDRPDAAAAPPPVVKTDEKDPRAIKSALLANELVTDVELKRDMEDAMLVYFHGFDGIVAAFVGLGIFLAVLFIVSVLGFLLLERDSEYATLRSMGYGTREIGKSVLTEVAVLGFAGFVASLGAWWGVSMLLQAFLSVAMFLVPLDFQAKNLLSVAVPILAFFVIAALPAIASLMRMQMASVLRGRSMG